MKKKRKRRIRPKKKGNDFLRVDPTEASTSLRLTQKRRKQGEGKRERKKARKKEKKKERNNERKKERKKDGKKHSK